MQRSSHQDCHLRKEKLRGRTYSQILFVSKCCASCYLRSNRYVIWLFCAPYILDQAVWKGSVSDSHAYKRSRKLNREKPTSDAHGLSVEKSHLQEPLAC